MRQRNTRQQADIAEVVATLDTFHSAQQIHQQLENLGKRVGLATVYRTLTAMAAMDEVDAITVDGEVQYRRCSSGHHHHIRCRSCGTTFEISAEEIEEWAHEIANRYGFTEIGHSIEISGLCTQCS